MFLWRSYQNLILQLDQNNLQKYYTTQGLKFSTWLNNKQFVGIF
jgi:hypothetical protein